jgi:hypothetical protein
MKQIYNLDWKEYDDLVLNSISYQYFPKEKLNYSPGRIVEPLLELEKEKIIYVPIGKNASTSIANSLNFTPVKIILQSDNRFDIDIPEKYRNGYKFFIVTRDPRERWVSGINEFFNIHVYEGVDFDGDKKRSRNKFLSELKNNKFIFDGHTEPQLSVIKFCFKYDLDITLLKLDGNLNKKISNLLNREVAINYDNPIQKYKFKLKNYKFCNDILTKYCMENEHFLNLYAMDFYLYDCSI